MALTLHEAAVPMYRQGLTALLNIIEKAEAYCADKAIDPAVLLSTRLFPNMQPFAFQVEQTLGHSAGALERLMGKPVSGHKLADFAAMKAAVTAAIAAMDAAAPEHLEGAEERRVEFTTPRGGIPFKGSDYVLSFAMQNFFFHLTTAYNILRHLGVDVGKRDFMGPLRTAS